MFTHCGMREETKKVRAPESLLKSPHQASYLTSTQTLSAEFNSTPATGVFS